VVRSLRTIGNALYSLIFLQSCCLIHEGGSDNPVSVSYYGDFTRIMALYTLYYLLTYLFQRYGHSKFSKMAGDRLLDLVQPGVAPFDPPSPKTLSNTKSIGRPVPEISSFEISEMLNFMTSLLTS